MTLKVMFTVAPQWRQTTADAVYTEPNVSEAGPADELGLYTGTHGQFHLNWTLLRSTSFAIEELQFQVGDAIRCAGGHNGDYIGIQIAYGW